MENSSSPSLEGSACFYAQGVEDSYLTVFPVEFAEQFSSSNRCDVNLNDLKSLHVIKLFTCDRVTCLLKSYPEEESRFH